ncbi:histidinol-phosphatase [Candidatus Marinamargulisbacteria bacterium SCGC AG-343-K17]|nr:histidinol-phosphatase [Candidatus Marinamargulisbacteria bacterium SCGC AG-343-K17]
MSSWIPFLTKISDVADEIALHYFNSASLEVEIKDNMTPVSAGDLAIENEIRSLVKNEHPELSIIGEEYGETTANSKLKLIIDPIDGTKNFIRGLPFFGSLFAIEDDGEIVAGMVSAPALKARWWASKGNGAFYNGAPIHTSNVASLAEANGFYGSLFGSEASSTPEPVINLLKDTYRQRGFGDFYPHMLVAMGCGEYAIDFKLSVWDIAPLKIIVEEAGGQFSNTQGENTIYSGNIISSNQKLHSTVLDYIQGCE